MADVESPRETRARDPSEIPVTALAGVGPRIAERLRAIGVETLQDVLFHLPLRYQDRSRVHSIGGLRAGAEVLVVGELQAAQIRYARRRSLVCLVHDGTGALTLRFFHFGKAQHERLGAGRRIACFGEVRRGPQGAEMVHPEYRLLGDDEPAPVEAHLTPVYPTTEGVNQTAWRRLIGQALARLARDGTLADHVPRRILARHGFAPLATSLEAVHRPPPGARPDDGASVVGHARQRLAFDELLAHHLSLRLLRRRLDERSAPVLAGPGRLRERFLAALPFALTAAQRRVIEEILADLAAPHPMHRLVQGDVGSGKTVVAAVAALAAMEAGHQAAFMAPTELLAEQHLASFRDWLEPIGLPVVGLTGKLAARPRRELLARIGDGEPLLAVGTHALFQEQVRFPRLGLVIIDEQHRFGVHQRLALRAKGARAGQEPHQLVMTATPIPRTLAMTAYADLDTSVIDELPPGRQPIETAVLPASRRAEVVARVHAACAEGQQAYWVCTLIEDSEALEAQAAARIHAELCAALPELAIGLVHGRLKPAEKDAVMRAFKRAELDLLVATTVIEVGVDVPNASLMIIENAERLGLAQLHQLRGRVGRGRRRSVCVMMYQAPLTRNARARLDVLRETTDGFKVAQRDLELRGPGEMLGTRQTGDMQLAIADLVRDRALLPAVVDAANEILARSPQAQHALVKRWLGSAVDYADV
ncbi:MAG: ATP-dependent DNA helicase RecG [Gammaproteobacteria bacterium]|nr:ATP-dependent DNA helicase RecG [Gammaproteobacteria bacterium]